MNTLTVGVIGCGKISDIYLKNLGTVFPNVNLKACADLDLKRAEEKAAAYGIEGKTTDALFADPEIDLVLNLTIPKAHAPVGIAALKAGKHVYSEKPLALNTAEGKELLEVAAATGLKVGCAPDTVLGAGFMRCRHLLDEGSLGAAIGGAATFANHGPEAWHPDPEFYFKPGAGPLFDMGPYYLTALVLLLGPVRRVVGAHSTAFSIRTVGSEPKFGQKIEVETPTHFTALLEFENGAQVTLMKSFDVWAHQLPTINLFCENGSVSAPDPNTFGGPIKIWMAGDEEWKPVELDLPYAENSRGLGVADMVDGILNDRPFFASGELAFHVLDIMESVLKSGNAGTWINLGSTCARPSPLPKNFLQ